MPFAVNRPQPAVQKMHKIEPYFRWRELYIASEDKKSPFFRRQYSEFEFTHLLYNFYLHPQWDSFGSSTLYLKVLFVDYDDNFALIEMIGEWNDVLHNDIMLLKRRVVEPMMDKGITKFVFFCENVLNFHAALEDDYYSEWAEELRDEGGWVAILNTRKHVEEEFDDARLHHYLHVGENFNDLNWQPHRPLVVFQMVEERMQLLPKKLT